MLFDLLFGGISNLFEANQHQQQMEDQFQHDASTPFSMGGMDLSQDAINPTNDFGSPFGGGFDPFGF